MSKQGEVAYRVALVGPAADRRATWRLHEREFATERDAEAWAVTRLFGAGAGVVWGAGTVGLHVGGRKRSTNAAIVRVVDGVPQVPSWMAVDGADDDDGD